MTLLSGDYVILSITAILALMGLIRGLSGMIAFITATAIAIFAATLGWNYSEKFLTIQWQRGVADAVATLLAFGILRFIIKKVIGGIISQPSDAIFGLASGVLIGSVGLVLWAKTGLFLEYSELASLVSPYVQ